MQLRSLWVELLTSQAHFQEVIPLDCTDYKTGSFYCVLFHWVWSENPRSKYSQTNDYLSHMGYWPILGQSTHTQLEGRGVRRKGRNFVIFSTEGENDATKSQAEAWRLMQWRCHNLWAPTSWMLWSKVATKTHKHTESEDLESKIRSLCIEWSHMIILTLTLTVQGTSVCLIKLHWTK